MAFRRSRTAPYHFMRFFVAITDSDWFEYLSVLKPDEVNFWQPSGSSQFQALQPGEPLLFKLHSPQNYIVGGGFFSHFSLLPFTFAWEVYLQKNGASSLPEMQARIEKYRRAPLSSAKDETIGCILLQQPFFLERADWIPVPDWPKSIVRGKSFGTGGDGALLWKKVQEQMTAPLQLEEDLSDVPKYGSPQVVLPRLGQAAFRIIVADNYGRRCAVTSSHILHVLDAAHIRPYARGGSHSPTNGVLFRQDVHTLFDRGYLTISPDYHLEVSKRIKEEFDNGAEYYALHGKAVHLPADDLALPSRTGLQWHNENVFKA